MNKNLFRKSQLRRQQLYKSVNGRRQPPRKNLIRSNSNVHTITPNYNVSSCSRHAHPHPQSREIMHTGSAAPAMLLAHRRAVVDGNTSCRSDDVRFARGTRRTHPAGAANAVSMPRQRCKWRAVAMAWQCRLARTRLTAPRRRLH